jgi:hypothetical protein
MSQGRPRISQGRPSDRLSLDQVPGSTQDSQGRPSGCYFLCNFLLFSATYLNHLIGCPFHLRGTWQHQSGPLIYKRTPLGKGMPQGKEREKGQPRPSFPANPSAVGEREESILALQENLLKRPSLRLPSFFLHSFPALQALRKKKPDLRTDPTCGFWELAFPFRILSSSDLYLCFTVYFFLF